MASNSERGLASPDCIGLWLLELDLIADRLACEVEAAGVGAAAFPAEPRER